MRAVAKSRAALWISKGSIGKAAMGISLLLVACVPHVAVTDAPCPCGEGFYCCPTSTTCLRNGEQCPDTYPPSSLRPCTQDRDCPKGEACASWQAQSSLGESPQISGPQLCMHACELGIACSTGETCAYSLHDNRDVKALALATLCVPDDPSGACAQWLCTGCSGLAVGETRCDSGSCASCMVSIHPRCGVTCTLEPFECSNCAVPPPPPSCADYPCDDCATGAPGARICLDSSPGDVIATCAIARPPSDDSCTTYCADILLATCPSDCVVDSDFGPICIE